METKETRTLPTPMAGSGEGERTIGFSVVAGIPLDSLDPARTGCTGTGPLHSLDYPCTTRLRLRRLLAFHRRYNFDAIYDAAKERMHVIFDLKHMKKLIREGRCRAASYYLLSFLRYQQSRSYECNFLVVFLQDLMALNDFADGHNYLTRSLCDWLLSIYQEPWLAYYPCFATLVADILFLRSDHARAFLKWQRVRSKAAEMAEVMAYKMPDLKDRLHFPRGRNNLYHVVAIGTSFHGRRPVKNLGRKQSIDLARYYLQLKKRLPSITQGESHGCSDGSARLRGEPLIALLEKALQAGMCSVLQQGHFPEYPSSEEGFPIMRSHIYQPAACVPLQVLLSWPIQLTQPRSANTFRGLTKILLVQEMIQRGHEQLEILAKICSQALRHIQSQIKKLHKSGSEGSCKATVYRRVTVASKALIDGLWRCSGNLATHLNRPLDYPALRNLLLYVMDMSV